MQLVTLHLFIFNHNQSHPFFLPSLSTRSLFSISFYFQAECVLIQRHCSFHKKSKWTRLQLKLMYSDHRFLFVNFSGSEKETKKKNLHLFHLCSFPTSLNWLRFFECRYIVSGYEWDALMGEFVASESRRCVN